MPHWSIPGLSSIPPRQTGLLQGTGVIALIAIIAAFGIHSRSSRPPGACAPAIGEYLSAADTAGINVITMRLVNVTLAGALAGRRLLCRWTHGSFERG